MADIQLFYTCQQNHKKTDHFIMSLCVFIISPNIKTMPRVISFHNTHKLLSIFYWCHVYSCISVYLHFSNFFYNNVLVKTGFVYGNCSKMIICTMMKTYWNNHNGEVDYENSGIGKNGKIDPFLIKDWKCFMFCRK